MVLLSYMGKSMVKEAHELTDMRGMSPPQAELPGVAGMGVDSLGQGSSTFSLILFHEPLYHMYAHCSGFAPDRILDSSPTVWITR